jgi:hypothetical protein
LQIGDSKELQNPFGQAAASLDYRLHHMLHLQHQFLHPLEHRLPFSSAFRPLAPSAFAPPQKRLKIETEAAGVSSPGGVPTGLSSLGSLSSMSSMFSPSVASQAADLAPQSPANSTSRSPPGSGGSNQPAAAGSQVAEEDREASATPCSENTERSTPEEGRPYRSEYILILVCCALYLFGWFRVRTGSHSEPLHSMGIPSALKLGYGNSQGTLYLFCVCFFFFFFVFFCSPAALAPPAVRLPMHPKYPEHTE